MENYKRIVLKVSGEALKDKDNDLIISSKMLSDVVNVIKEYVEHGLEVGVVVGAGNIWRGKLSNELQIDQVDGDYMGMIATTLNCLAIKHRLVKEGVFAEVLSALPIKNVVREYSKEEANKLLDEKKVVIFAGGTGKPFFTTDTCAALRAIDINADVILMAKDGVEGVYTDFPLTKPNVKIIKNATYQELIDLDVKAMDKEALELLKDTDIEMIVFNMNNSENFLKVLKNATIGTHIKR